MGSCLSSSAKPQTPLSKNVRIVHLNGMVEDFNPPISVNQLITATSSSSSNNSSPKHFICTPSQLLSPLSKPLNSDHQLEPGTLYFLLPYSTLRPDVSRVNLATLVKQLTKKAQSQKPEPARICTSRSSSSPSPERARTGTGIRVFCGTDSVQDYNKVQRYVRAWRPILDTILERSFRTSSDLHERNVRNAVGSRDIT